jgi:hypothetical protein
LAGTAGKDPAFIGQQLPRCAQQRPIRFAREAIGGADLESQRMFRLLQKCLQLTRLIVEPTVEIASERQADRQPHVRISAAHHSDGRTPRVAPLRRH